MPYSTAKGIKEYKKCAGFRVSGYWKGWPCGATPTVDKYGKSWCRNHLPLNDNEANIAIKRRESYETELLIKYD